MSLYLVPATQENLEASIEQPVPYTVLEPHLGPLLLERLRQFHAHGVYCWAMTGSPGMARRFDMMQPGDDVLFTERGTGRFTHHGKVVAKVIHPSLGDDIRPLA